MPWIKKGKTIYKKEGGKLVKKQTAKSEKSADRTLKLLRAIEHGWKPKK